MEKQTFKVREYKAPDIKVINIGGVISELICTSPDKVTAEGENPVTSPDSEGEEE